MKIYLLLAGMVLVACNPLEKKKQPAPIEGKEHRIDQIKASVHLPEHYLFMTSEQWAESFAKSGLDEELNSNRLQSMRKMAGTGNYVFYIDSLDPRNVILFSGIPRSMQLDKSTSSQAMALFDKELRNGWQRGNMQLERQEAKFFAGKESCMIKLKYQMTDSARVFFLTFYLVDSPNRSVAIQVFGQTSEDLEKSVTSLKFNP